MPEPPLLVPGRNCWKIARATRAAFLIDGDAYFRAARESLRRARRSILMLAWDIDSRVRLVPEQPADGLRAELGEFLNTVVSQTPGLWAHILTWDFAMVFAHEREWFPLYKLGWKTHRRIRFHMDDVHPVGACHHQKVLVVDDRVAFVGGLDLTDRRWDTQEHRPVDPRRVDIAGQPYGPFHDVQMVVEGEAAAALADLARERWRIATGKRLKMPRDPRSDPWPEGVSPDLLDADVAIVRTQPAHAGAEEVREAERLYLDTIAAARRSIYIESQYFTSTIVAEALTRRLAEPASPDIVIVIRKKTEGWLSPNTLDVIRARLLTRMREADGGKRLRVYCPTLEGLGEDYVNVHSKVMVVDDRFARVGSSNLCNRSMGLDTECDLAVEAGPDGRHVDAITGLRDRLLAEHLGAKREEVAAALEAHGSLIAAIEALNHGPRRFEPIDFDVPGSLDETVPEAALVDPERPIEPQGVVDLFVPKELKEVAGRRAMRFAISLLAVLTLVALWRFTPMRDWLNFEELVRAGAAVRREPFAPLVGVGVYLVGGLLGVPVILLMLASTVLLGPLDGFVCSLVGAAASAALLYAVGRRLRRNRLRRLAGRRLNRLTRQLERQGIFAIIAVRVVPVASFTQVNLVAGASRVPFGEFLLGTVLGMAPGLLALAIFAHQVEAYIRDPHPVRLVACIASGGLLAGLAVLFGRYATRRAGRETRRRADKPLSKGVTHGG